MRKIFILLFSFIAIVSLACNFPIKSWPQYYAVSATPYPTLYINLTTPISPTPLGEQTGGEITNFDPNLYVSYLAQSGDTLPVVASHFGTTPDQIFSPQPIPAAGLIPPGQQLIIPRLAEEIPYPAPLLPDSAVVDSPCVEGFDIEQFIYQSGGFLSTYTQEVNGKTLTGAQVVRLVEQNTSVNPRLLLAWIEFRSGWLTSHPAEPNLTYPLDLRIPNYEGLYLELSLSAKLLNTGYYAWRQGLMTDLIFADARSVRIAPELNAGSVGLQYLFAQAYRTISWENALYGPDGFLSVYTRLFGNAVQCADEVEPLFPAGLQTPLLELPFAAGEVWALTGGLHVDWNTGTPLGALDFAPVTGEPPCAVSRTWVLASAGGTVIRSENGIVLLALEDENQQRTGWELLYMHVAEKDRVAVGTRVKTDDPLGHPSCEGGDATGTHVHLARKYRGEWIGVNDAFPFVLSGWKALPGEKPFVSTLVKNGRVVTARPDGMYNSQITR